MIDVHVCACLMTIGWFTTTASTSLKYYVMLFGSIDWNCYKVVLIVLSIDKLCLDELCLDNIMDYYIWIIEFVMFG